MARQQVKNFVSSLLVGNSASIVYGNVADFKRDTFSIAAWVKQVSVGANLVGYPLTANSTHFYWGLLDTTGAVGRPALLRLRALDGAAGNIIADSSVTAPRMPRADWRFVCVTVETVGTLVTVRHYINSQLLGAPYTRNFGWSGAYGAAFQTLSTASSVFSISELMFSSNVLSPTQQLEIQQGYLQPQDAVGMISYWPMTENAGNTVMDAIGNNHGTFGATPPTWITDVPCRSRA